MQVGGGVVPGLVVDASSGGVIVGRGSGGQRQFGHRATQLCVPAGESDGGDKRQEALRSPRDGGPAQDCWC